MESRLGCTETAVGKPTGGVPPTGVLGKTVRKETTVVRMLIFTQGFELERKRNLSPKGDEN
jgi:hypothetical protein